MAVRKLLSIYVVILGTTCLLLKWPLNKRFRFVCLALLLFSNANAINTQQAHEIIRTQYHHLLGGGHDLVSLYFFGSQSISGAEKVVAENTVAENTVAEITVIGLERVGDDYLPVRWLLIFRNQQLLGWYHPVAEFPKKLDDGKIHFPQGLEADVVSLFPQPQSEFTLQGVRVNFAPAVKPTTVNHSPLNH